MPIYVTAPGGTGGMIMHRTIGVKIDLSEKYFPGVYSYVNKSLTLEDVGEALKREFLRCAEKQLNPLNSDKSDIFNYELVDSTPKPYSSYAVGRNDFALSADDAQYDKK